MVLRSSGVLALRKVDIDLALVRQVKRERSVHLFESQGRIALDHALGRHAFAKEINERVQRNTCIPDSISALNVLDVILMHDGSLTSVVPLDVSLVVHGGND